jgi:aquaporin Z
LESKELSDSDFNEELSRPSFGHHNPDGNRSRTAAMLTQEFIGTFFLSWTAALSVDAENPLGGVLAVGAIITSVAYAGGAISGAHYNPAVTASVYLRGLRETPQAMRDTDAIYYIVVQFAAAFAASGAALWVQDNEVQSIACPQVAEHGHSIFGELSAEFLFTYLLLLCVLNVGTAKAVAGNSYFGIAIGFVIIGAQICVSDISGSVLNPAVALALPVVGACSTKDVWIFIIAEMAAAPFAAATFLFWHLEVGDPVVERPSEDNDGLEETDVGVARGEPSSKSVHWTDGSDASPLWTLQVNSSN